MSLSHNLPEHQPDSNDSILASDNLPSSLVKEDRDIRSRSQLHLYFKKPSAKRIWHRILSVFTLKMEY